MNRVMSDMDALRSNLRAVIDETVQMEAVGLPAPSASFFEGDVVLIWRHVGIVDAARIIAYAPGGHWHHALGLAATLRRTPEPNKHYEIHCQTEAIAKDLIATIEADS